MAIKIGDKVRFLNSVGGGTVVRMQGKDLVMVEDEDGFEVPVLAHECVVVGATDGRQATGGENRFPASAAAGRTAGAGSLSPSGRKQPAASVYGKPGAPDEKGGVAGNGRRSVGQRPADEVPDPDDLPYIPEETAGGDILNVSIAFLPESGRGARSSGFETYLINESNYYLLFNYMSTPDAVWTSRFHGMIEPNTQLRIDEFALEVLNNFAKVALQFVAFKEDKPYGAKQAFSIEYPLDGVKFYKQSTFGENEYFDEGAWIIPLVRNDRPAERLQIDPKELQRAMMQKAAADQKAEAPAPVKKEKQPGVLEVDLHIHQLLDSVAGLSNGDMLNYQLDKFHEVLKENARNKGLKIVFIHGKGGGVLRKAIEKELRTRYKEYYFQDASFKEYGFGATMVTIR